MKKFSDYIFNKASWLSLWLISLVFTGTIVFPLMLLMSTLDEKDEFNFLGFSLFMTLMVSLLLPVFIFLGRKASNFFDKANAIEKRITDGEDKDDVFNDLKELQKLSFHNATGSRIRELGKMYEVKYGVKILK